MMSASQWISCVCLLMCFLNCISEDIKAKPGGDVLLQCHGPTDAEIKLVKCIRPDLKSEGFVFYFRDKHPYKDKQHPFFFDRVELRDPEMKDGDVSVILKNVTVNDTGTYECYVGFGASSEFISSITLTVRDSGGTAGHTEEEGKKNKETKNGGHNNQMPAERGSKVRKRSRVN